MEMIPIIGTTVKQRFGPGYTVGGYCFLPLARKPPSSRGGSGGGCPPRFPTVIAPGQSQFIVLDLSKPRGYRLVSPATRARARIARTREESD